MAIEGAICEEISAAIFTVNAADTYTILTGRDAILKCGRIRELERGGA